MVGLSRSTPILLLACLLTLGLGLQLKDACNGPAGWKDSSQYRMLCYSDIPPLYYVRHFHTDTLPYREYPEDASFGTDDERGFLEYPLLTGLLLWFAAILGTWRYEWFGPPRESYPENFYWNAFLLAFFAVGLVLLLSRMVADPRRVLYFAAGTPLMLYAFHNLDLLALFFAILGLYWFERNRFVLGGIAFALGAASKLYPILFPPLLFLVLLRRRFDTATATARPGPAFLTALGRCMEGWKLGASTIATLVAVHAPFLIWGSPRLVWKTYEFHLKRSPNPETLWWALHEFGAQWGFPNLADPVNRAWLEPIGAILFLSGYGGLAYLVWWRRLSARYALLGATLVFLLLNKIFSVQYALWVLPFFALLPLPAWSYVSYAAADLAVYITLFPTFVTLERFGTFPRGTYVEVGTAVVARTIALALLLGILIRHAMRRDHASRKPPKEPATQDRGVAAPAPP